MNVLNKRLKRHALLWVFRKTKKRLPAMCLLTAMSVCTAWFGVQFAISTKTVIDAAQHIGNVDFQTSVVRLAVLITATIVINLLKRHVYDKLAVDLDRDMKQTLMQHILRADYRAISKYRSGDLVHRMNTDVATVTNAMMSLVTEVFSLIVQTCAVIAVVGQVSLGFTLAVLGICIVIGAGTIALQQMLKKVHKQINDASGRISGFLQEVVEKLLIVQALDVSIAMESKTDAMLEERWKLQRRRKNLGLLTNAGLSILGQCINFVTLVWCAFRMLNGSMTFGSLTAITQLAGQLQTPVYMLPWLLRELTAMSASAERLMEIEDVPEEPVREHHDLQALYADTACIRAQDLSFAFHDHPVLKDLSFDIPKGSMTVIVGQSGSGKSTLLRLMLSIYKPKQGSLAFIMSDGSGVKVSRSTRRLFTYAPQGNLLLSGSLRDNILFAKTNATESELQNAIHVSAMDDFIDQLPNGLDTQLGENSAGLSEGQAQRVSLARAVISGAPIMLLDEVTSALDLETEQKVLQRIRSLENRTCIVVTHRPAVLAMADVIINIVDGRMVNTRIV